MFFDKGASFMKNIMDIDQDHNRFRDIIRGKIKKDLKKYVSQGELIGKRGKDFISIPVPQIDLPDFRFGRRGFEGVGQGEGEPGTPLAPGDTDDSGGGEAGNASGQHILEVDLTMEELAQILGEGLELPRIKPKGKNEIYASKFRFTSERRTGPESLRRFRPTFKRALKRQMMSGAYDPENPCVIPIHEDKRFLSWREKQNPESNALICYIMDVSGSMGDEQKEIVRTESFWIDTWIETQYKKTKSLHIIHDAVAQRVDRETFYHTRESGGTVISSAYELFLKIQEKEYPESEWNIYVFHFSDGDNWSGGDNDVCATLLKEKILPIVNLFGYGQVESAYGTGQFINELESKVTGFDNLVISRISKKADIYQSIKDFLGRGM